MFSTVNHFETFKAGRVNLKVVLNADYGQTFKIKIKPSSLELRLYSFNFRAQPTQNQTLVLLFPLRSRNTDLSFARG